MLVESREDLVGQLTMYGGIQQRRDQRLETEKVQNIALKVERAFDLAQGDQDLEEVDDDVDLISKAMKRLWTRNKASPKPSKSGRDMKEVVCYHCQGKGHYAKQCPKKRTEEGSKSMVATWDVSNDEEDSSQSDDVCLMAKESISSSEVNDSDFSSLLAKKTREQLVSIIEKLGTQVTELNEKLEEKDETIANLIDDNKVWSDKAIELEKVSFPWSDDCNSCKDLKKEVHDLEKQVTDLEGERLMLKLGNAKMSSELESLKLDEETKKKKWMDEFVVNKVQEIIKDYGKKFVREIDRSGIGYASTSKVQGTNYAPHLSKGKAPMYGNNASCSIHTVADQDNGKQHWYPDPKVYNMWQNQI